MKELLKLIGASALALALAVCGCGKQSQSESGTSAKGDFKPMAAKDATIVLGVNLDKEQLFNLLDFYVNHFGSLLGLNDDKKAVLKSGVAAFKQDPFYKAPQDIRTFVSKSGLCDAELRWAVLSVERLPDDGRRDMPDSLSLAVAVKFDFARLIEAIQDKRSEIYVEGAAFKEVTVNGEKAWQMEMPGLLSEKMKDAEIHLASLDNQLLLVSLSRGTLEKQIRLYRSGYDESDALRRFSAANGELLHLSMSNVGDLVRQKASPDDLRRFSLTIPNGDQVLTGLGRLELDMKVSSAGAPIQSFSLETASERDADQLCTLFKMFLMMARSAAKKNSNAGEGVRELFDAMQITGDGRNLRIEGGDLPSVLLSVAFPAISSVIVSANGTSLATRGRKIVQGVILANAVRKGTLPPVWPRTARGGAAGKGDDVSARVYGSAADYFNALFDMKHYGTGEWKPIVDGELVEALGKGALKDKTISASGLDWCVAANVTDDMPDSMPVLISANFNPALLLRAHDGQDSDLLPIGPKSGASRSMLEDKAVVVVHKDGEAKVIKGQDLTYAKLFRGMSFERLLRESPVAWLTPNACVESPVPTAPKSMKAPPKPNDVPRMLPTPPPGVRYTPASTNAVTVEEALAELNGLVGLKPVKEEVARFVKFVRVAQQRKAAGLKVAPISYHMVFTGNPGTGKTTVARIMAKIYKALGVVKKGHLVECNRAALVADGVGQTAIKTGQVIDFALDGILFIDEAHSLMSGPQDSCGEEAISTLLKRMEEDRDRIVVIVAGRTDEMKTFIDANSGLASRFNRYVEFPDYTMEDVGIKLKDPDATKED